MLKLARKVRFQFSNYKLDPWLGVSKLYIPIWIFFLSFFTDLTLHFPLFSSTFFSLLALFYAGFHFLVDSLDKKLVAGARVGAIKLLLITYLLFCWGTSLSFLSTRVAAMAHLAIDSQARADFTQYGKIHKLGTGIDTWAVVRDSYELNVSTPAADQLGDQENCRPYARLIFPDYYLLNISC